MNVFFLLVPIALLLAGAGVAGFFWSVTTGQYDDVDTPAIRMLLDDESPSHPATPDAPDAREPASSGEAPAVGADADPATKRPRSDAA